MSVCVFGIPHLNKSSYRFMPCHALPCSQQNLISFGMKSMHFRCSYFCIYVRSSVCVCVCVCARVCVYVCVWSLETYLWGIYFTHGNRKWHIRPEIWKEFSKFERFQVYVCFNSLYLSLLFTPLHSSTSLPLHIQKVATHILR